MADSSDTTPNHHNHAADIQKVVSYDEVTGLVLDDSTTIPPNTIVCVLPADEDEDDEDTKAVYTLITVNVTQLLKTPIRHTPPALLSRYLFRELPPHLSASSSDLIVIVSTGSGGGSASAFYQHALTPLLLTFSLTPKATIYTTSPTSITENIISLHSSARPQTVFLLSGDTGIHEAINAPASASTALCIFPLGTGNALASSLHTSRGVSPLSALIFGSLRPLPTFTARFSRGCKWLPTHTPVSASWVRGAVVVSWGFHASLVADADALRGAGVGIERFKLAAAQNLEPPHRYIGKLSILPPGEGAAWREIDAPNHHFYALATMCSNLEEAFRISPSSQPGERVIRVVHFPAMEGEEVMALMGGAYTGGSHVHDERVGYEVAKGVRIQVEEEEERWRRVCIDGGTVVVPKGGWVECTVDVESADGGVNVVWMD